MTKAYFKWDGRTGITAIIGVTMIQYATIIGILVLIVRFFYTRAELRSLNYSETYIVVFTFIPLLAYNYRKYDGTYNKLRKYWQNEEKSIKIKKGVLVVLCLILCWVPIILAGVWM